MRSLVTITAALALVAMFTTAAFTQEATDARVTAMGGVRAGLAHGASAFLDNPAGLPYVDTFGTRLSPWPIMVSGSTTLDADIDVWSILGSARNSARTQGIGAGIWHADADTWDADFIGVGYGLELPDPIPRSVSASISGTAARARGRRRTGTETRPSLASA